MSILNKAAMLDDNEWEMMKSHAAEGAWDLAAIEGTPPLAVIVAFEHHLRHDGRDNDPVLKTRRTPHLAPRPHQKPLGRAAAFEVLRKRSSTFYDPASIEDFIRLFGERTPA